LLAIRSAGTEDAHAIAEIYRPIVESTAISFEETAPDDAQMARRIAETTAAYPWLLAESNGAVFGYAYAGRHRERSAYRYSVDVSVYLAEEARGRGIGSALYAELFKQLQQRGFHRAFAGIALPNEASIALHRRFGFELVGVYKEVGRKFDRWIDVAWWQRAVTLQKSY
jgi:L-amino acid N-acyltransferase YncA